MRWYVLPFVLPWESLLGWLETHALPQFGPRALAHARRLIEPSLRTSAERHAEAAIKSFEQAALMKREQLVAVFDQARKMGDEQRYPLLYGSGSDLANAIARLLGAADFVVEKLDETLGAGRSGDLLVSKGDVHSLVEVTSSAGATSETEIGKLEAHLGTWPHLRSETLQGGVLIVNHDYNLPPAERPAGPFRRQERLDSLTVRVMGTLPLCRWWANEQNDAIHEAITGPPGQVTFSDDPD